ncbi:MAG: beta-phosphoglucomutase family hydrolase [Bacteroidales bacterium]|nr:beta-phosphoglucomutase family hydrolase [Bacteroidales bacterium]
MSQYAFEAVIFDLDGVITQTALVHSHAWKKMFDEYLQKRANVEGTVFQEFTREDYLAYVDGKPRYDGVRSFLESRTIELPFGSPEDTPDMETVCGLGNKKNEAFNEVLKLDGVETYPSTVAFMNELKAAGIRVGVASSSKNCESVLEAAGLTELVETRVDGVVSAEMGLKGKPAPDIFLTAARNLGANPHRSVVVEDATSGVAAGKNGNFGLVLGIAREDNVEALLINGADVVVKDMEETSMNKVNDWFLQGMEANGWKLEYNDYAEKKERSREALLAVGNGYFGTRGAMEETDANAVNYPGTYIAGVYNRLITPIAGKDISNEDFVNCPNWLPIRFKVEEGSWFDPNKHEILSIHRTVDFKTGVLYRNMLVKDDEGNISKVTSERFASMDQPHLAAIRYSVTPVNYSGVLTFWTALDGALENEGVERYKALSSKHLEPVEEGASDSTLSLKVKTNQSQIEIAESARLSVSKNGKTVKTEWKHFTEPGKVYSFTEYEVAAGETLELEKVVALHTSLETTDPLAKGESLIQSAAGFDALLQASNIVREKTWEEIDIQLTGDRMAQKLLRMHLYHLLISASQHNEKLDASVTARGLHGEAYRGHIFWDELFILPFYDIHMPKTAKSLLMYRYNRLEKAREYAKEYGYKGAMFPWQSGSDGSEETQVVHLNPVSGEWGPDHSSLQRHVSLAVAYDVWEYFHLTNDVEFLENYGMEMLLEIARFWESKSKWDQNNQRFSIDEVMGPDEFHEKYTDAEKGGLKDNAYTNIMVAWLFKTAAEMLKSVSEEARKKLFDKLQFKGQELSRWNEIRKNLRLVISDEGIIAQYDGYFELKELDWDYYRNKYGNVYRMDRLLKAEGKSADEYKVAKQADMLMTFYNLDTEEVNALLKEMSYELPSDYLRKNLEYYLQRTSHGSTLSRVVHAQLAEMVDDDTLSWELYSDALSSDYNDIQGGTTGEGIHAGVMAGTIMIALNTYGGIDLKKEQLHINPNLPQAWEKLKGKLQFKGVHFQFEVSAEKVCVTADADTTVVVKGNEVSLSKNKSVSVDY